jgi:hypothetical protein
MCSVIFNSNYSKVSELVFKGGGFEGGVLAASLVLTGSLPSRLNGVG